MSITLQVEVPQDGTIALSWEKDRRVRAHTLLVVRTGMVPAFNAWHLGGKTNRFVLQNLSRHQRYRVALIAANGEASAISPWFEVTPRLGVAPRCDGEAADIVECVSRIQNVTVMPQDQRMTVYWKRSAGFADKVVLDIFAGDRLLRQLDIEPEVSSISLDAQRGIDLENGTVHSVRLHTKFSGVLHNTTDKTFCITAAQGEERAANATMAGKNLVYPTLSVMPELCFFDDDEEDTLPTQPLSIVCGTCGSHVEWQNYQLVCRNCGAQFIPNGRGDFLDMSRLRFGTCSCCLPKKIIVQRLGSETLVCAHSGKEHIRASGSAGYWLIEDLPFGLCQCCRPRRPLVKVDERICCSKSNERHTHEDGTWVLVPSDPVFDASAIDDLLDQGLAEICSTGVSRASAATNRRAS